MSRLLRVLTVTLVCLAVGVCAAAVESEQDDPTTSKDAKPTTKPVAPKPGTKKKTRGKKGASKPAMTEGGETPAADKGDGKLKFSRDIAPIFVANCVGCHNSVQKKGKFDLSSFEKLTSSPEKAIIIAGNAAESHLVMRIKGELTPKMPPGAQRNLSAPAIAKIEQWVKEGAILDAGVDPKAAMAKIAASPEDLRKGELAKLPATERDKQVETVGLARWKKANPKVTPQVTPSAHFMLFSSLPKERASAALKVLETQYTQAKTLLGPSAVDWGEKASLFVFNDQASFGEFVKTQEKRETESSDVGSSLMNVPQPFVVVLDPLGGKEDSGSGSARKGRSKKSEDSGVGLERTLPGLLTEYLVIGTASRTGKPPRWLALGLGAWVAAKSEPKSGYAQALRAHATELCQLNWASKATEAMGDASKTEEERTVGYAIVDWLSTVSKSDLVPFIKGMEAGGEKIDDVIAEVLQGNREMFLKGSEDFIMTKYGR